ncbi:MAG: hypothetical protein J5J06_12920 [Phycisphaerae bacterium]|nr:hypothetical protein [Phycisphaerae bacterium]
MQTPAVSETTTSTPSASRASGFEDLRSEDFLKLLITQLTTQDPLEPTGNEELLQQISSIRDIELSTSLTDSLKSLTGQQRYASAAALIGQHVTSTPDESGQAFGGVVTGVRFDASGQALLRLSDGTEMPLERVGTVVSALEAARLLIGKIVTGVDLRDPSKPEAVEGLVTTARQDDTGDVVLELDTGESLRLRDIINVTAAGEV